MICFSCMFHDDFIINFNNHSKGFFFNYWHKSKKRLP